MIPRVTRRRALASGFATACAQTTILSGDTRTSHASPTHIVGVSQAEKQTVAELGNAFRSKFDLPGVSLAMSYRGKLKLLACFGHANAETHLPVRPEHRFRVASVSKPITAVGILRLCEQQVLGLDERVFAQSKPLAKYADEIRNETQRKKLQKITVRHLLEHTCGGWSNQSGVAPMFAKEALGLPHTELIRWTLKNRPLNNEPGTTYAYSNFGYCLLGRIIEAKTGKDYERAIKELVLNKTGATSTVIGRRLKSQRWPQEVIYYDEHDPYGINMDVARMDAHGGWISTPSDLVRFVHSVDGTPLPKDILHPSTLKTMTAPRQGSYALGWNVNASNNWWHTGSFNGGSSILARIHDGHCWAVTVNTRSYKEGYFGALDQFPWQIRNSVQRWGTHDLLKA